MAERKVGNGDATKRICIFVQMGSDTLTERGIQIYRLYKEVEEETCSILKISTSLLYALEGNPEHANMFKSAKKIHLLIRIKSKMLRERESVLITLTFSSDQLFSSLA